MKVTMLGCWARPEGIAKAGAVVEVTDKVGKELIDTHSARPFDGERDKKAPRGLVKPPETFA